MDERTISHMLTDVHIVAQGQGKRYQAIKNAYARYHGSANVVLECVLVDGSN